MNSVTPSNRPRFATQALASIATLVAMCGALYSGISSAGPLTEYEQAVAQNLANSIQWQESRSSQITRSPNSSHPLAQQTISVEPHVSKSQSVDGQVRVYQFDYDQASARLVLVSLIDQRVLSVSVIPSVHLPLNPTESKIALDWLAADKDAIERLRADQIRRGRRPFNQLSELAMKASIFVPIDDQHECAYDRCALFSVIDKENTVFSMAPVINLQRGTVGWLFP